MTIQKIDQGNAWTLIVDGRMDTCTAPQFEEALVELPKTVSSLDLDFKGLTYISSAGLRSILGAQKKMNKQGKMVVHNVNETVSEIFDITGFADILTIE